MSKIGISNLHYAVMSTEETSSSPASYGTVTAVPGTVSANITPSSNKATLYADNGPYETASSLGEITLALDLADLDPTVQADLLGHTLGAQGSATEGQLDYKASDVAPYCAVMFEYLLGNGKKRCVKLYKGKFSEPADEGTTKGENVEFQTSSIEATFVQLKNNGLWKSTKDFDADASTAAWYSMS